MFMVRWCFVLILALCAGVSTSYAQGEKNDTLLSYVRARKDLSRTERRVWIKALRREFGGTALEIDNKNRPEIAVAKEVISAAIFMRVGPKKGIYAAWEAWRGALGYVPPPIAVHYQILTLEGRRPRGRMIDLAFRFPDYYSDEIAPDLVAYWESSIEAGTIPDAALTDTLSALRATRIKMRPLLLDKLRSLARLARRAGVAPGNTRVPIENDIKKMEAELKRAFKGVAQRPEVLDAKRRPFDRLRIQLEVMNQSLSSEDRLLDPKGPPPPKRQVPQQKEQITPTPKSKTGPALSEPSKAPPPPPPPPQPRPGDRDIYGPKLGKLELKSLLRRYLVRLQETITPWLGTPYRWGGNLKQIGTDCSGFTQSVFKEGFRFDLPRVSRDQYRTGVSISRSKLRPGDLVFFDTRDRGRVNHVGIYMGKNQMIHASSSRGVVRANLKKRYYRHAYRGARRILASPR
jgi:hypothetical protein